jgi:hypothetical protein
MSRFNLKNNPELAKERHRQQNKEWYQRNKEYVMEKQREYRKRKKQREIYKKFAPLLAEDAKKWFAHKARVHKLLFETKDPATCATIKEK